MSQGLSRVAQLWGESAQPAAMQSRQPVSWMLHPWVRRWHINVQISGDPDTGMLPYFKKRFVPLRRPWGLTLGCGDGCLERHALQLDLCERFDAFDVAPGAIEVAREGARKEGIDHLVSYEVREINRIVLEEDKYDLAFAFMSAHHFQDLEHVFDEVQRALRPEGLFMLDEFVGPSQFQWTDRQLDLINEILALLPARYRELVPTPGKYKTHADRPSIEWMNDHDPSEAIRSAEILPELAERFDIVERIDYGGTLLHELLKDIAGNFREDHEEDLAVLKLACLLERTLVRQGLIPSDFVGIVARNRKAH